MTLVDTSVWIDYFNGVHNPQSERLDALLADDVVLMGDLILLEILQGIRDDRAYHSTREHLWALDLVELFGAAQVNVCAGHYRALRKQGITIRKTADVIIASFCIHHDLPLLFRDRDFQPFVDCLGLKPALDLTQPG